MAKNAPRGISSVRSSTAVTSPNRLVTPSRRTSADVFAALVASSTSCNADLRDRVVPTTRKRPSAQGAIIPDGAVWYTRTGVAPRTNRRQTPRTDDASEAEGSMAEVLTGARGAFVAGAWEAGEGEEIEVRSPRERRAARQRAGRQPGAGGSRGAGGAGGLRVLAPDVGGRPRRALPQGVRALPGAQRGDGADHRARGRQDDPRGARGDGGVHLRPLPARGGGHAAPRRAGAAVHAGARGPQAHHRGAGARRRRRGRVAVELPRRHRRDPDRVRPGRGLHRGLEAVGVRAAVRGAVRAAARRRRLPGRHRQPGARARRHRPGGRAAPAASRRWCSRARSRRASRWRATPACATACSSSAATARRSCWPTRTWSAPRTRPSWAATTSRASAAPPRSASWCTARSPTASPSCWSSGRAS